MGAPHGVSVCACPRHVATVKEWHFSPEEGSIPDSVNQPSIALNRAGISLIRAVGGYGSCPRQDVRALNHIWAVAALSESACDSNQRSPPNAERSSCGVACELDGSCICQ